MIKVKTRKQLAEVMGKTLDEPVVIIGLSNVVISDVGKITAPEVILTGVTGGVTVSAPLVIVGNCRLACLEVEASHLSISQSSIDRLVVASDVEDVRVTRANLSSVSCRNASDVVLSRSHVGTATFGHVASVRLYQSYADAFYAYEKSIAAVGAAVGRTNMRFIDAGTDARGYRINIFAGHKKAGAMVRAASDLDGAEKVVWITAGCRELELPDALKHWEGTPIEGIIQAALVSFNRRDWMRTHDTGF